MGKTTGFLEYPRAKVAPRPVAERLGDWAEVAGLPAPGALRTQAARCMDCGVPFCHAAFQLPAGSIGCPLANLIPEVNDLVYRGDISAAFARLATTNPFPEITGRVCPALCEGSCILGEHKEPVAIKDIERYVADTQLAAGLPPRVPGGRTGRRVAVVGSGPAGLACADLLNQLGEEVTVYDKADRPGGLLMYGIPTMKLEKSVVLGRAALLEAEGVSFALGCEVGVDVVLETLLCDYDAVVLCLGAAAERRLSCEGRDLPGVVTSMQYLTAATRALLAGDVRAAAPSAAGKRVVVVGGGDTGTDCVATALRQGAKSVVQLEIAPRPPKTRPDDTPWPLYPRLHKVDYGQAEAIALQNEDPRRWQTTLKQVVGGACGGVEAVETVRVQWVPGPGGPAPAVQPGTEERLVADLVITAMGFTGPEAALPAALGLAVDARGCIQTGQGYATSHPKVFAAGDARRGASLVVWAIAEGRAAAAACHTFLKKE